MKPIYGFLVASLLSFGHCGGQEEAECHPGNWCAPDSQVCVSTMGDHGYCAPACTPNVVENMSTLPDRPGTRLRPLSGETGISCNNDGCCPASLSCQVVAPAACLYCRVLVFACVEP